MSSPNGKNLSPAPIIKKLDSSRSLRRSLLSNGSSSFNSEDSPTGTRRCTSPSAAAGAGAAVELSPRSSRPSFKLVPSDELPHSFVKAARISWIAYFILATFAVVLILLTLGIHHNGPVSTCRSQSLHCPSSTSLPLSWVPLECLKASTFSSQEGLKASTFSSQEGSNLSNGASAEGEDEKCISRTRHWKFRKPDRRHPPSLLLDAALSQYASMHARCTVGKSWEHFLLTSNGGNKNDDDQQQQLQWLSGNDSCKYLMYMDGWEGLGNRLLSLVSAFAYALITDRVLLLDSRRHMPGLLCEPFGNSWALPKNFPYEKADALPTLGGLGDETQLEKLQNLPAVNVILRHVQSESEQRFFCPDVQRRLNHVPWIGWTSNQYYVPRLLTIPEFWMKFSPMIDGDPSKVFTQLSRFLLLPQNSIWARTERVYRAYLAEARKLVGIQLRTPQSKSFEQPIQDRIMRCLVRDGVLPRPTSSESGEGAEEELLEKPRDLEIETGGVSIFVASLQRMYFDKIRDLYEGRGAEDGTLVRVHTMAADLEGQENNSQEQAVRALVDMWLLSFSDSLVTSGWSTFGYVAQGLGGVEPYIINTDHQQSESCGVGQSAEPCNHFPFLSACPESPKSMSMEQALWIEKHVKACPDEPNGLQLVSNRTS